MNPSQLNQHLFLSPHSATSNYNFYPWSSLYVSVDIVMWAFLKSYSYTQTKAFGRTGVVKLPFHHNPTNPPPLLVVPQWSWLLNDWPCFRSQRKHTLSSKVSDKKRGSCYFRRKGETVYKWAYFCIWLVHSISSVRNTCFIRQATEFY